MPRSRVVTRAEQPPNRIAPLRLAAGLTLDQMAERLNTARNTYHDIETGRTRLSIEWMRRIARVLGCAPADLLPREDLPYALEPDELSLLQLIRSLPPEQRALVPRLVTALGGGAAATPASEAA